MRRYFAKRQYVWSPDTAYIVGLMASDGCLLSDGRHLDLTSKDRDQLLNFCHALGRQIRIGLKNNGKLQQAFRVQFSDVALYDFLLNAGLTPAKSKTLGKLNVPDIYYADFLRGLFDGDGSTYSYMDPRWRSSYMFYVLFCSASSTFISYIQQTNARLIDVSGGAVHIARGAKILSYAKADSHKLFKYMYYDGHGPSLDRKKSKLSAFVRRDQGVIM